MIPSQALRNALSTVVNGTATSAAQKAFDKAIVTDLEDVQRQLDALTAAPPPAPPPVSTSEFGVFIGSGAAAKVAQFEAWVPRTVQRVVDFCAQGTWADVENPSWVKSFAPRKLSLSVPLVPAGVALTDPAGHALHFTKLAQNLVLWGHRDAIIRLGWEFNGGWFPWKASANPGGFVGNYRSAVSAMRAVSSDFRFDWCFVNRGADPAPAYPGDAFVDYIGNDVYDQSWVPNYTDPLARWNDVKTGSFGLDWQAAFATAHGKRLSFPEWGVFTRADGHGGGDSPVFIQKMSDWLRSHNVAYHAYFEYDAPDGQHALMSGRYPLSAAKFKELFRQ